MAIKLNHTLFSAKRGVTLLQKRILIGALAVTVLVGVAANWDRLTKTDFDRFQQAYEARRFDEALQIALGMVAEDPTSAEAQRALATVYIQKAILRQDFEESARRALEAAQAALELDRDSVETRRLLAFALELSGRYDDAEIQYRAALDLEPSDATSMAYLAAFYEKRGKFEPARQLFQRAVIAEPGNEEARVLYARFFQKRGDPDGAIEIIAAATSSERAVIAAEANRILSSSLLDIGDVEHARVPAERALALAPDSAQAVENYGRLVFEELFGPYELPFAETLEEVRGYATRAIELDPSLARPYFLAFKVAHSQNDSVASGFYARRALDMLAVDKTLSEREKGLIRSFIRSVPNVNLAR